MRLAPECSCAFSSGHAHLHSRSALRSVTQLTRHRLEAGCGQLWSAVVWVQLKMRIQICDGAVRSRVGFSEPCPALRKYQYQMLLKTQRSSPLPTKAVHFGSCDNLNSFKKKSRFSMLNSGFEEEMIRLPEKGRCTKEGSKVTGKQHFGGGKNSVTELQKDVLRYCLSSEALLWSSCVR